MTRCWMRNLVSRNDSRSGTWASIRPVDTAPCRPLGGVAAGAGAPGWVGDAGGGGCAGDRAASAGMRPGRDAGRALSIRLSSDIDVSLLC